MVSKVDQLWVTWIEGHLSLEAPGPGCRSGAPDYSNDEGCDHPFEQAETGDSLTYIVQECCGYNGAAVVMRTKRNDDLFGDVNRVAPIRAAHTRPEILLGREELASGPGFISGTRPTATNRAEEPARQV